MRVSRLVVAALLLTSPSLFASGAPEWFESRLDYMTAGTGTWIASNEEWRSEGEPFDEYGIRWVRKRGPLAVGELFGMRAGEEIAVFWDFVTYWDPVDQKAVILQTSAGGVVGIGENGPAVDSVQEMVQTFVAPGSEPRVEKHEVVEIDAMTHRTTSLRQVDGEWTRNRTYTWHRQPSSDTSSD